MCGANMTFCERTAHMSRKADRQTDVKECDIIPC